MIKLNRFCGFIASTALIFTFVGCSPVGETKNTVVATVNNESITLEEVDDNLGVILDEVIAYYGEDYKNNKDAILFLAEKRFSMVDTLVNDIIFKNKAIELGVMPTEEELLKKANEQLTKIKNTFWSEDEYKTALSKINFTEDQLIEELKSSTIYELVYEEATKDVKPTNEAILDYYESNKNSFTLKPNRVKLAHILVNDATTAKEIISKLDNGADFSELAAQYGTDSTQETGGDLGWVEYSSKSIDSSILSAGKNLKVGEYSASPVQTQFGFHVIMCLDKEIFPIQPLDKVKDEISEKLIEDKKYTAWTDIVKTWQDEADIKLYQDKLNQVY